MKKYLKFEGNTYEGIFMPLPGKQNYGHMMVSGILLYHKTKDDKQGAAVEFGCGRADEVFITEEAEFNGFFNLDTKSAKPVKEKPKPKEKPEKPIKLNKREEIQAMSKDAEEIIIAMKRCAVDGVVFLKEVKDVNQNKLYGHLTNLVNAGIIKRLGKDKKRGTKVKLIR